MTASSDHLIIGSSHAAIAAIAAIRSQDAKTTVTVLTRDHHFPYSPTLLPYVVSGRAQPETAILCDTEFFAAQRVRFERSAAVAAVRPETHEVALADGTAWHYDKLLLATGAAPLLPAIAGLSDLRFHCLRSLDDSLALRAGLGEARRAVVLGAGLIGMHAAENLVKAGIAVTVIEPRAQVLPGYFDAEAAAHIAARFAANGVVFRFGRTAVAAAPAGAEGEGCRLTLDDGVEIAADLLLIATGVRPACDYLAGSGIATDRGILVDALMQTSAPAVWAAGDVAEAPAFPGPGRAVAGILPEAVAQGRIAGMAMAGDAALQPYRGSIPRNTYGFFGETAISVGAGVAATPTADAELHIRRDRETGAYWRIALRENRLLGIAAVNLPLDAGILCELIRREIDLAPCKARFIAAPRETAQRLMSRIWR